MRRLLFAPLISLLLFGCTTTKTVVDRVEVPVPYWNPPQNIQPLPPRVPLEYVHITPESAKEDPREAFRALGEDIRTLIEENEHIRFLYDELVKRISKPQEEDP